MFIKKVIFTRKEIINAKKCFYNEIRLGDTEENDIVSNNRNYHDIYEDKKMLNFLKSK